MRTTQSTKPVLILVTLVTLLVFSATPLLAATIVFDQAVHFVSPSGENVVVGPGMYAVEAAEKAIRLTPKGGEPSEAILVKAETTQHGEKFDAPRAESIEDGEDEYRVELLLPNATILEATGSYSGVRARSISSTDTRLGRDALKNPVSGNNRTAIGNEALRNNITGRYNTAIGSYALRQNSSANQNTATGVYAMGKNSLGSYNTANGYAALNNNNLGRYNTGLGYKAGYNQTTGSHNIYLNNLGAAVESGTIRIGQSPNQTRTYIAGISGVNVSGSTVRVASNGKLGVSSSSRRYKEDIRDMDSTSHDLLRLRPVTFRYKKEYIEGERSLEYGLIAEEVAEVYPDLVTHNANGQVESVQYHKLTTMLLNELQKEHQKNLAQESKMQGQAKQIQGQAKQIDELRSQLTVVQTQNQQLHGLAARLANLEVQVGNSHLVLAGSSDH